MEWLPHPDLVSNFPKGWKRLTPVPTSSHPLHRHHLVPDSGSKDDKTRRKSSSSSFMDPLSAAAFSVALRRQQDFGFDEEDDDSGSRKHSNLSVGLDETVDEEWARFRTKIIDRFSTQEKLLTIRSSFLDQSNNDRRASTTSISSNHPSSSSSSSSGGAVLVSDQVAKRLQQLSDTTSDDVKEERGLTSADFGDRIDSLKKSLIHAWSQDQRVKALKIVIQSAKMLQSDSNHHYYPSLFCVITGEILDLFGSLVHERIRERSVTASHEVAIETCRNWIYKISSIRELIPRFFVEVAILRTHVFLDQHNLSPVLFRLSRSIRGIAEPLVACFARAYLARVALKVTTDASFFKDNFCQVFLLKSQLNQEAGLEQLLAPALTWDVQSFVLASSSVSHEDEWFTEFIGLMTSDPMCRQLNQVALTAIVACFSHQFLVSHFDQVMHAMDDLCPPDSMLHEILISLGRAFSSCSSTCPGDSERILRSVWAKVSLLPPLVSCTCACLADVMASASQEYTLCAVAWIEFVSRVFPWKQVHSLLKDVLKHTSAANADVDPPKADLIRKMCTASLSHGHERMLLSLDGLQPLVHSIRDPETRVSLSKTLLTAAFDALNRQADQDIDTEEEQVNLLLLFNNVSLYCKVVHDSVLSLSAIDDDRREAANLISSYIRLIAFPPDDLTSGVTRDQQLMLLQDARASFYCEQMDSVLVLLVSAVLHLISSDQVADPDFVRTCLAFAFTTIPAVDDAGHRIRLHLMSSETAFAHSALSQLDSFLKAAMHQIMHQPDHEQYIVKILSLLLLVPDHPDHEPLYLLKGLLSLISENERKDSCFLMRLQVMGFLSAAAQSVYPVRHPLIDSNDVLYGGGGGEERERLDASISTFMRETLDQMLDHLASVTDASKKRDQSLLLLSHLITYSDVSTSHKLICKLCHLLVNKIGNNSREQDGQLFQRRVKQVIASCRDPGIRDACLRIISPPVPEP